MVLHHRANQKQVPNLTLEQTLNITRNLQHLHNIYTQHIYTHTCITLRNTNITSVEKQTQTMYLYKQVCIIHKYEKHVKFTNMVNIFKYQYKQVKIYNMCDIYKNQKQRNYRNANSIKTPILGNGAILLKAVISGSQAKT